jgi:hypothetical protein
MKATAGVRQSPLWHQLIGGREEFDKAFVAHFPGKPLRHDIGRRIGAKNGRPWLTRWSISAPGRSAGAAWALTRELTKRRERFALATLNNQMLRQKVFLHRFYVRYI